MPRSRRADVCAAARACAGASRRWFTVVTLALHGDHVRRRLPRHRHPAAPPDRPRARGRRRASSPTTSRRREPALPSELSSAATTLRARRSRSARARRLLFALVPGSGTSTNQPELFARPGARQRRDARRAGPGEPPRAAARARADRLLDARAPRRRRPAPAQAARCAFPVGLDASRSASASRWRRVAHAQRGVARAFVLAGLLALAAALLASYLVGTRVSRPLRRMAARGRAGGRRRPAPADPRRRAGEAIEVRVLADAFNHMLDRLTEAFAGQRAFVADASHELRTPLTVIRGQLEVLASQERAPRPRRCTASSARAGRDRADQPARRRPAAARQDRADRSSCASSRSTCPPTCEELWDGMTLLAEPALRARPGPAGHAARRSATASPRRCAT